MHTNMHPKSVRAAPSLRPLRRPLRSHPARVAAGVRRLPAPSAAATARDATTTGADSVFNIVCVVCVVCVVFVFVFVSATGPVGPRAEPPGGGRPPTAGSRAGVAGPVGSVGPAGPAGQRVLELDPAQLHYGPGLVRQEVLVVVVVVAVAAAVVMTARWW